MISLEVVHRARYAWRRASCDRRKHRRGIGIQSIPGQGLVVAAIGITVTKVSRVVLVEPVVTLDGVLVLAILRCFDHAEVCERACVDCSATLN